MFAFLQGDPKGKLKAMIEKAREKHEQNLQNEQESSKKHAYKHLQEQIVVLSQLGKFQDSASLIHENTNVYDVQAIEKLQSLAKKEELAFLTKSFKSFCVQGDKERASALLADIQARVSDFKDVYYQELFDHPEYIGNWKESLLLLKIRWAFLLRNTKAAFAVPLQHSSGVSSSISSLLHEDSFQQTNKILENAGEISMHSLKGLPEENVNEFENIFGDVPQNEKDILESILEKGSPQIPAEIPSEEKAQWLLSQDEEVQEVAYINPFLPYLPYMEKGALISLLFMIFSWMFFFIQIDDKENQVLGYLNQDNIFKQYTKAEEQFSTLQQDIKSSESRLKKLEGGILEIPGKTALQEIQARKIDWMQLHQDLHTATVNAFPYNDVLKYIQYTNFQGDVQKESLTISGTITDPSGRVFMLITNLIDSINNHPSFSGAEMKTFTKTKVSKEDTKGFSTSFSLTLKYHQDVQKTSEPVSNPISQQ